MERPRILKKRPCREFPIYGKLRQQHRFKNTLFYRLEIHSPLLINMEVVNLGHSNPTALV